MILVEKVSKSYAGHLALKNISFEIRAGELYGLLGPNGAGKTTTISILSTLIQPDSGRVSVAGIDLKSDPQAGKRSMGVVPQEIALYNNLSAVDNLRFWGGLYGLSADVLKARIDQLLIQFGLNDRKNDKINAYSGGMKRRINIAAALLHKPKVLFMDEPTVGIDPQSRNLIFEVIEKLHQEGMTIVYTTHYMEEAERLCDRIGIIDNGEIVAQGTLEELKRSGKTKETIVVTFADLNDEVMILISKEWPESNRSETVVRFYSSEIQSDLSKVILKCSQLGLEILNIEIQRVNLESVFLSLTGKQLRDQ